MSPEQLTASYSHPLRTERALRYIFIRFGQCLQIRLQESAN